MPKVHNRGSEWARSRVTSQSRDLPPPCFLLSKQLMHTWPKPPSLGVV